MLRKSRTLIFAALAVLALAAAGAHAQSPLGVGSAEPSFSVSGPLDGFFAWINTHQQAFYRALTAALRAMREDPWALAGLIGLSFAYGVFHAAGPGHGKAVISSYMVANETALKRGILISFISALVQGATAVLLVGAAYFALRGTGITMTRATWAMEVASFALIALFGAWLLLRKLHALKMRVVTVSEPVAAGIGKGPTGLRFEAVEIDDHEYRGSGGACETCGNAHIPDPALLKGRDFSLHEAWSAIIAVGLRPCSGAILVMSFSLLNGLYLGGLLSVLAMSIGTAITVAILAILAVTAKDLAVRFAGPGSRKAMWAGTAIEIAGALFVLLMGLILLGASLQG
jgi:nickel/cobalt transporter (NicO) family protein